MVQCPTPHHTVRGCQHRCSDTQLQPSCTPSWTIFGTDISQLRGKSTALHEPHKAASMSVWVLSVWRVGLGRVAGDWSKPSQNQAACTKEASVLSCLPLKACLPGYTTESHSLGRGLQLCTHAQLCVWFSKAFKCYLIAIINLFLHACEDLIYSKIIQIPTYISSSVSWPC